MQDAVIEVAVAVRVAVTVVAQDAVMGAVVAAEEVAAVVMELEMVTSRSTSWFPSYFPQHVLSCHRSKDGLPASLSQQVRDIEFEYQKNTESPGGLDLSTLSLHDKPRYPTRPGFGTKGQKVMLWSNHFEMDTGKDLMLYLYDVAFTPSLTGRKLEQMFNVLLEHSHFQKYANTIVSDKRKFLVSCSKFGNVKVPIKYQSEEETSPSSTAQTHTATVQLTNSFTVSELIKYLSSTTLGLPSFDKGSFLQALNIFLGNFSKSDRNIVSVGSSKCFDIRSINDRNESYDLGAGLRAVRGYFNSIRLVTGRILVNVNVSHIALYNAGPLTTHIYNFNPNELSKLESFLWNVRVKLLHVKSTFKNGVEYPRIRTIRGLASPRDGKNNKGKKDGHPPKVQAHGAGVKGVQFWLESEGKYISVFDYFQKEYGRQIQNVNMPVVNTGTKENPIYMPAEVCEVIPGQPAKARLSPTQTQKMIEFSVRKPWKNANSITSEGVRTVGLLPDINSKLETYGVTVSSKLISVAGRVLGEPQIIYKGNKKMTSRSGSWNLANVQMNRGATLKNWECIAFPRSDQDAQQTPVLLKNFTQTLRNTGLNVENCKKTTLLRTPADMELADDTKIRKALKDISGGPKEPRLALVILPDDRAPLYRFIRNFAEKEAGIHVVCVVFKPFIKDSVQNYANNAMKFNLRLGGINQMIEQAKMGIIAEDNTMVVGLDVTHPSPGSSPNAPSVAGIVASIDKHLGQWPGQLSIQEKRKEMVTDLKQLMKSRLQLWRTHHQPQRLPQNILVYRDGVSEGQYVTVLDEELPEIRAACEEMYPPADTKEGIPHITISVVGKRHHVRFYPVNTEDADRSENPKNGTVVDRGVTEARNWHFYLQAHTCLQGTARPAHYYMIHDEIFTKRRLPPGFANAADVFEDLTHSMCYLFPRATKAVSICPPAYLADRLCERGRVYLQRWFDPANPNEELPDPTPADVRVHQELTNTMFYL